MNSQPKIIKQIRQLRHVVGRKMKVLIAPLICIDRGKLSESDSIKKLLSIASNEILHLPAVQFISKHKTTKNTSPIEVKFPSIDIYKIKDARLIAPNAHLLTNSRKIITEHTGGTKATALSTQKTIQPFSAFVKSFNSPTKIQGSFFSINGPNVSNYYHWFTDHLVQLLVFEQLSLESKKLIIPVTLSNWQIRSLELLNYDSSRYQLLEEPHLQISSLILTTYHKPDLFCMCPMPSLLQSLRNRMLGTVKPISSKNYERIFISRADSSKKRIANESEIRQALENLGFTSVVLGHSSLDEQINIFSKAKIIVAAHGAGLTNLLFSNKPVVIEIFPKDFFLPYFYPLVRIFEGQYFAYHADCETADRTPVVNCDHFIKSIKNVMSQ